VTGWESFEPWLGLIESFPDESIWALADEIPAVWYEGDMDELHKLLAKLLERRARVRELVLTFKNSSRNPFVNWKETIN
jgi:hypothetical protein